MRMAVMLRYLPAYQHTHDARLAALDAIQTLDLTVIRVVTESEKAENKRVPRVKKVRVLEANKHSVPTSLAECEPDVVVINGYSDAIMREAARWARKWGAGVILFSETTEGDRRRWWVVEEVKRHWVSRHVDCALVGGAAHRRYIMKLGIASERTWKGYDVVDNGYFSRRAEEVGRKSAELRDVWRLPGQYFLYVGRLAPEKNLLRLLQAYRLFRESCSGFDLVLVGDGPQRSRLQRFSRSTGIQGLHWLGWMDSSTLPIFYSLAEALVLPSVSEPWGLVVNEAMACSRPVLVSNRCGCAPELVESGRNGFTFDPYNVNELAGVMLKVAQDGCDRQAMGRASREIISHWSPELFAENLLKAAEAAMNAPRRRATPADRVLPKLLAL